MALPGSAALPPGPHWIGIGAQRAATTWMAHHLRNHPELWLPPRKELHVFSRSPRYPSPTHLHSSSLWRGLLGLKPHDRQWRRQVLRSPWLDPDLIRQGRLREACQKAAWQANYLFGRPRDMRWYHSLFEQGKGKLCGEITPAYALLEQQDVNLIAESLDSLKVIFIIRNPLERGLSQLRLHKATGLLPDACSEAQLLDFLMSPLIQSRNNYLETIRRWRQAIPEGSFLMLWHDDILASPKETLEKVFRFLDVKLLSPECMGSLDVRVNRHPDVALSPNLIRRHAIALQPGIAELATVLGSHAEQWLSACERVCHA
jgi:hypothetical protein